MNQQGITGRAGGGFVVATVLAIGTYHHASSGLGARWPTVDSSPSDAPSTATESRGTPSGRHTPTALTRTYGEAARAVFSSADGATRSVDGFTVHAAGAREGEPGLAIELPDSAARAATFRLASGTRVSVLEEGLRGAAESLSGTVSYARDGGRVYWTRTEGGLEEWLSFEPGLAHAGRVLARWAVEGGVLRSAGEAVHVVDPASGRTLLTVSAPEAWDTDGAPVRATLTVEGARIALSVDADGRAVFVDPRWVEYSALVGARMVHVQLTLPDGDVLVAGGRSSSNNGIRSVERWDNRTGTWASIGTLRADRAYASAVYVAVPTPGGATVLPCSGPSVFVFGGQNDSNVEQATVDRVCLDAVPRVEAMTPMISARDSFGATPFTTSTGGVRILLAGGIGSGNVATKAAEVYDPTGTTGTAAGATVAVNAMTTARRTHAQLALDAAGSSPVTNKIMVVAGLGDPNPTASCELFDTVARTWSNCTNNPTQARYYATASLSTIGGRSYVVLAGGQTTTSLSSASRKVDIYDVGTGLWSPGDDLTYERSRHTQVTLAGGSVMVIGGMSAMGNARASTEWLAAPRATEVWHDDLLPVGSTSPKLNTTRHDHRSSVLPDSTVLVTGGTSGDEGATWTAHDTFERYFTGCAVNHGGCDPVASCTDNANGTVTCGSCPAGTRTVITPGTADRCEPCVLGFTYQDVAGQTTCKSVRGTCAMETEYQELAPTTSNDRVCTPLSTLCDATEYQVAAPTTDGTQNTGDRTCAPLRACSVSTEYQVSAPTLGDWYGSAFYATNRVCAALSVCGTNQWATPPATDPTTGVALADRMCRTCSVCSGTPLFACTATTDTICQLVCGAGAYRSTDAVTCGGAAQCCVPLTSCTASEYESVAPTSGSDRVCSALTVCTASQYEAFPPTATTNRFCLPLSVCTSGQYESAAPTATSDRSCSTITSCSSAQYQVSPPTATGDRVCAACTVCGAGQPVLSACSATSNTVCGQANDTGVDVGVPTDAGAQDAGGGDAGHVDGGTPPVDEASAGGCGCVVAGTSNPSTSTRTPGFGLVALGVLLGWRGRTRRSARARRSSDASTVRGRAWPSHARSVRSLAVAMSLLGTGLLTSGCGDEPAGRCVRSAERLAENRTCRFDEDCPCGAGCELGLCVSACTRASDCATGVCDDFGRCRDEDDKNALPGVRTTTGGRAVVSEPVVYLGGAVGEQVITVSAVGAPLPVTRVAAGASVLVRCGDEVTPASSCTIRDLQEGESISVRLSAAPKRKDNVDVDPSDLTVTIHDGTNVEAVGVSLSLPPLVRDPSLPAELVPGQYSGVATLIEGGVVDGTNAETMLEGLGIAITLDVYSTGTDTAVVAIHDPTTVLVSSGTWVGEVRGLSGGAPALDLPTVTYLSSSAFAGFGPTIDVRAGAAPTPLTVAGHALSFDIPMQLEGVLGSSRVPRLVFHVMASRQGELPANSVTPTVPDDVTGTDPTTRTSSDVPANLSVWEAAARAAIPALDVATLTLSQRLELLNDFAPSSSGQLGDLRACRLPTASLDRLGALARATSWGTAYETATTPTPPAADALHTLAVNALAPFVASPTELTTNLRVVPPSSVVSAAGMPCDIAFASAQQAICAGASPPSATLDFGTSDRCMAMVQAYGCAIEDAPPGQTFAVTVQLANGTDVALSTAAATSCGAARAVLSPTTIVGSVRRLCRLPAVAQACGELVTCASRPDAPADGSVESRRFAAGIPLDTSGDLRCGAGGGTIAASDLAPLPADQLLTRCAADFARLRASSPSGSLATGNPRLTEVFDTSAACVDFARAVTALGFATEVDRRRGRPSATDPTPVSSRVAQRIVQRLAQQLAFNAREAAERENLAEMLRAEGTAPPTLESAQAVADRLLPFWDLLLHPRFATALDAQSGLALATPDYRDAVLGLAVPSVGDSIDTAVPVDLLELAAAELDLLERRLYWAALDRDTTALGGAAKAIRYSLVVRTLTHAMAARAATAAGATPPSWASRYNAATRDLGARGGRLIAAITGIVQGTNPLGIEEEDMPIYYFDSSATPAQRYFAVSDYLLGVSSWLPPLVADASASFTAVRTSYYAQLGRATQQRRDAAQLAQAISATRGDFGTRLSAICMPSGQTAASVLDDATFDENTCYRNTAMPTCGPGFSTASDITLPELQRYLCIVRRLRKANGDRGSLHSPDATAVAIDFDSCSNAQYPVACGSDACLSCGDTGTPSARTIRFNPSDFVPLHRVFGKRAEFSQYQVDAATTECDQEATTAQRPVAVRPLPNGSPAAAAQCFNGSLGEAIFAARAASAAVTAARADALEHLERHRIALRTCEYRNDGSAAVLARQMRTTAYVNSLDINVAIMHSIADIADSVGNCTQLVTSVSGETSAIGAPAAIVGCGAYGVAGFARTISNGYEADISITERNFELFREDTLAAAENRACTSDAELELVGFRSAAERITQALVELEAAALRVDNLKREARTLHDSGRAAVAALQGTNITPLAFDLWSSSQLTDAWNDMRLARRVTYLAVRAVEFEVQQSLGERDDVLRARLPSDLDQVITALRTYTAPRQVNGRPPSDLKVVLSLRDDILQVGDHSDLPDGEHASDPIERFRIQLTSARYAEYDANGTYLGQRIPFTLLPFGQLGLGETHAIPVLTGSDCAERLWAANATILGPAEMVVGSNTSMTRIDLRKQNTFASQWCGSLGTGSGDMQWASVRPSRNLFTDPTFEPPGGVGGALGLGNEATQEASARIEPHFNVSRVEFENDAYANGSTTELAGRGLYGDYALFIPAAMISRDGSNGLLLQSVEDVLIRLDYVSVAR